MNIARKHSISLLVGVITLCALAAQSSALSGEPAVDLPAIKVVNEKEIGGRTVIRYEHGSMPQWGYMTPKTNVFNVVLPSKPGKKPPLCVVLHSAGGNVDEAIAAICKPHDRGFYGDETYCVLCLDCARNREDWWWGNEEIARKPAIYKTELCPTEKRVLATIEGVIRAFDIDHDRVYLNGISMGGSGSLGIGLIRGDVFAAVSVVVPAGVKHMKHRTSDCKWPDPPPLFDISSQLDDHALGQEDLLNFCRENKCFLSFAWGPFGHTADVSAASPAVYEFPWLTIRKNEAYPVFTHATTDDRYPGHNNKTAPDQKGQINGYFRWKNIEDTATAFAMELRLVRKDELRRSVDTPQESVADVSLRRLQKFTGQPEARYRWSTTLAENVLQSGQVTADADGVLTIPAVRVSVTPSYLKIVRDVQAAEPKVGGD
jgi:pimeloyl-ACP methyl ester carboxylesterase